jgi:tetratricopeptide (TPR) repeat protein
MARKPWLLAVVLVAITFAVYIPALRAGFVFDDYLLIVDNQLIKAHDGLARYWFTTQADDYWPLAASVRWLEWRLWGNHATGYHVVNVLFHAANAVLVWLILRRLKIPGAWLAGLVFAIHPVNVATGAWISEQKNTLSMFFSGLALLLYLRFDETGEWHWYDCSLAAFLLALLSKTAGVMLPVVVLGCVWWLRGRVTARDIRNSVRFFALALVMGLVTIWFQHHRSMGGHPVRAAGFAARLATAGWAPWFYLYKALVPVNLTMIYPKWQVDATRWVSYVPGVILIGSLAVFWWKRNTWGRPLLFGLGYFVVMLFPVLGFFDQAFNRFSLVADHWQYYAIVGPIALMIAGGELICRRWGERGRYVGTVTAAFVVIVLGTATWNRCTVYANNETLWRDNVAKNPQAAMAYNDLGFELSKSGRLTEAVADFEQALRIDPDLAEAHNNLGFALEQTGKFVEAIDHYQQVLRINPDIAETHNNLGDVLAQTGRFDEAIDHYQQALRIRPNYAVARNNLGNALIRVGKVPEAIAQFEQAVRIKPDYANACNNLAWQLATREGSGPADWARAVQLAGHASQVAGGTDPRYLDTLAAAYAASGQFPAAIATVERAIALARTTMPAQRVRNMEARLELYRSGRAYHPLTDAASPHSP